MKLSIPLDIVSSALLKSYKLLWSSVGVFQEYIVNSFFFRVDDLFRGEPHTSPHHIRRLRSPECGGWSLSGKCYSGIRLEKVSDLADVWQRMQWCLQTMTWVISCMPIKYNPSHEDS